MAVKEMDKSLAKVVLSKTVSDDDVKSLIGDQAFHDMLEGKKYDFDIVVRLTGQIKQGYDRTGEIAARAKWQQMFVCLLEEYNKVCLAAKLTGVNLKTIAKQAAKLDAEMPDIAKEKADAIVAEIKESTVGLIRGQIRCNVVSEINEANIVFAGDVEKKK
jgi:hypothetical protein